MVSGFGFGLDLEGESVSGIGGGRAWIWEGWASGCAVGVCDGICVDAHRCHSPSVRLQRHGAISGFDGESHGVCVRETGESGSACGESAVVLLRRPYGLNRVLSYVTAYASLRRAPLHVVAWTAARYLFFACSCWTQLRPERDLSSPAQDVGCRLPAPPSLEG